jgi:hypothetical protein
LALHNFESAHRLLPAAGINSGTELEVHKLFKVTIGTEHSWIPFAMPFFERSDLADQYRFDKNFFDNENKALRETVVKTLRCPSNPNPLTLLATAGAGKGATTDYSPNREINTALYPLGRIDKESNDHNKGIMRFNELRRFHDVTDGLSNTLLLMENAGRPQLYRRNGKKIVGSTAGNGAWADDDTAFMTHGFANDGASRPGPCPINCTNDNEMFSFHARGVLVAMADGSVRFLADNTPIRVVGRLITYSGGEATGDF